MQDDTAQSPDSHCELNSEPFSDLAAALKAAADGLRLQILRLLARGSYGVLELCKVFEMRQSGMSHHLKVLATAGLVATRREGNSIFYRRAPAKGQLSGLSDGGWLEALFREIDQHPLPLDVARRLQEIQEERAALSQAFFAQYGADYREQQDLIASHPHYGAYVASLLASADSAIEVGPGDGEFLADLAPHFKEVIALDNSAEMLDRARQFATQLGLNNLRFIHGDTADACRLGLSADCVVVNMVLHHTPQPEDVVFDLSRLVKPGGRLLLTELCHHHQNWAHEACGDLWLGFDAEDLFGWAKNAGLECISSQYFALRNGFQIQIHEFSPSSP